MGMKLLAPDAKPGTPPAKIVEFKDGKLRVLDTGANQVDQFAASGKNQSLAETALTLGFGGSGRALAKAFTITDQGTEQMNDGSKSVAVEKLDLVSTDPAITKNYSHITIWVDTARDISLKQVLFEAETGGTKTMVYTNVRLNQPVKEASFATPCKGKCDNREPLALRVTARKNSTRLARMKSPLAFAVFSLPGRNPRSSRRCHFPHKRAADQLPVHRSSSRSHHHLPLRRSQRAEGQPRHPRPHQAHSNGKGCERSLDRNHAAASARHLQLLLRRRRPMAASIPANPHTAIKFQNVTNLLDRSRAVFPSSGNPQTSRTANSTTTSTPRTWC